MPTLERFAREAVVFEHAYSHFPQTQQSHWIMFTSTLPDVHRFAADAMGSPYTGRTLAEHLAAEGYATGGFVGGLTLTAKASGLDRGFGTYDDAGAWGIDRDLRPASEVRAAASRWMADQDGPYFAFVNFFEAHSPYEPKDPRRYDPDYTGSADGSLASLRREWSQPGMSPRDVEHVVALYDAEITELDEELGLLLAAIPPEALVVVTSDHGESFDHGYLFNHPEVLYDSVLHVPLLVRAPGIPARREAAQVGLMDVAPTLLALLGLPALPDAAGQPLLPKTTERAPLYARSRAHNGDNALLAARTPTVKAIFEETGTRWAYDLVSDPLEKVRTSVPGALGDAEERYRALVASDLARWPFIASDGPDAELTGRLEALGYAVGAPPAGGGPGDRPNGPPPNGPDPHAGPHAAPHAAPHDGGPVGPPPGPGSASVPPPPSGAARPPNR